MTATLDTTCPVCFSKNDGHADVSGEDGSPSDGDISLCAYCGTLGKYVITEKSAKVIPVSEEERKELLEFPEIRKAIAIGRAVKSHIDG